jgi:iron complex outermembrane receptor protein
MTDDTRDPHYDAARRAFLVGYDRKVPKLRQAGHCTSCEKCLSHCPQGIAIDKEMKKIHRYTEALKQRKQTTDLVKDKLLAGNYSLVVESVTGNVLTFEGRGVKDLYALYVNTPEILRGAVVADKVIGTGAATLMALAGIKEYYTNVISKDALSIFENKGIKGKYGELVAQINNRGGSGRCPLESALDGHLDSEDILTRISEFVNSIA